MPPESDPTERVAAAYREAATQVYGSRPAAIPAAVNSAQVDLAAARSPHYVHVDDAVDAVANLQYASPQPLTDEAKEALRAHLQETAGQEAKEATNAAGVDPSRLPPITVEASAPNMLSGAARRTTVWAFVILAFACVIIAPFTLLSSDSNDAAIAVSLVVLAAICVLAAWFTTMGYGKVAIKSGGSDAVTGIN